MRALFLVSILAIMFLMLEVVALRTENVQMRKRLALAEDAPPPQVTTEQCVGWLFNADLLKAKRRICGK